MQVSSALLLVIASVLFVCRSTPVDTHKTRRHQHPTNIGEAPFRQERQCSHEELMYCFLVNQDDTLLLMAGVNLENHDVLAPDCENVTRLGECIENAESQYGCNSNDVKNTTDYIAEALIQRKGDTVLKSYYVYEYTCSDDGQEMLADNDIKQCLADERIGQSIVDVAVHIDRQWINYAPPIPFPRDYDYSLMANVSSKVSPQCKAVSDMLTSYGTYQARFCKMESGESAASKLWCNSVAKMIKGVYMDEIGSDCVLECNGILKFKAPVFQF